MMMKRFNQTHYLHLRLKDNSIRTFKKPAIMGIINRSPDSFYQPYVHLDAALYAAEKMIRAGVDMIDVGAVASNPDVNFDHEVAVEEEIERVVLFVQAIAKRFDVLISVDTSHPKVMQAAVYAGAEMINDQHTLRLGNALQVVKELAVPVCLMHHFSPKRIPRSTSLQTLLMIIKKDLNDAVQRCLVHGISPDRIIIDPGFGGGNFGKDTEENFYLLSRFSEFTQLGFPVLVGWSRKSMIGDVLRVKPEKRLFGSISAAVIAAILGAAIIRVHDVPETIDAVRVAQKLLDFV